jgi:uncharacterized protein YndB with AHSA1/START domain
VRDLHEAWSKENDRKRIEITRDAAAGVIEADIPAARPTVWEHFTAPGHRPKWQGADAVIEKTGTGRRGVGTQNHCMHGSHALVEDVVDWRPFDYVTMEALVPVPNAPKVIVTYAFIEIAGGHTRVEVRLGKSKPKDRAFFEQMLPEWQRQFTQGLTNLALLLKSQRPAPAVVEEPAIPISADRFISQPIHVH